MRTSLSFHKVLASSVGVQSQHRTSLWKLRKGAIGRSQNWSDSSCCSKISSLLYFSRNNGTRTSQLSSAFCGVTIWMASHVFYVRSISESHTRKSIFAIGLYLPVNSLNCLIALIIQEEIQANSVHYWPTFMSRRFSCVRYNCTSPFVDECECTHIIVSWIENTNLKLSFRVTVYQGFCNNMAHIKHETNLESWPASSSSRRNVVFSDDGVDSGWI